MSKVITVNEGLVFGCGLSLYSDHDQNCCEQHYLDFSGLSVEDFSHLEFDLTSDKFFERVDGYGIRLIAINGVAISIPGYASNNGYYSSNLSLVLFGNGSKKTWDITDCQDY